MLSGYPSFTRDYVLYELASVEGWALVNHLVEGNPWGSVERDSDGYVAQEAMKKLIVDSR